MRFRSILFVCINFFGQVLWSYEETVIGQSPETRAASAGETRELPLPETDAENPIPRITPETIEPRITPENLILSSPETLEGIDPNLPFVEPGTIFLGKTIKVTNDAKHIGWFEVANQTDAYITLSNGDAGQKTPHTYSLLPFSRGAFKYKGKHTVNCFRDLTPASTHKLEDQSTCSTYLSVVLSRSKGGEQRRDNLKLGT